MEAIVPGSDIDAKGVSDAAQIAVAGTQKRPGRFPIVQLNDFAHVKRTILDNGSTRETVASRTSK